MTGRVII